MINARSLLTIKTRFKIAAVVAWIVVVMFLITKCFNLVNAPDDMEVGVGVTGILALLVVTPWFITFLFRGEKDVGSKSK